MGRSKNLLWLHAWYVYEGATRMNKQKYVMGLDECSPNGLYNKSYVHSNRTDAEGWVVLQ